MPPRGRHAPRSTAGTYPRALLQGKRGNLVSLLSCSGQRAVRCAYGGASLGCRKKRRPCCNGADTGFNVTRPERGPTSDGSFVARDVGESLAGGKANDNRGIPTAWCIRPVFTLGRARLATYRKARTTTATAYCEGRPEGSGTGSGNGLLKGLSGVRGKLSRTVLRGAWRSNGPRLPGGICKNAHCNVREFTRLTILDLE